MAWPVSTVEINRCEVLSTSHLVQQVFMLWKKVRIFYFELIKHMIIHAKSQRAIWLFAKITGATHSKEERLMAPT